MLPELKWSHYCVSYAEAFLRMKTVIMVMMATTSVMIPVLFQVLQAIPET
jgi:hypothetical protein